MREKERKVCIRHAGSSRWMRPVWRPGRGCRRARETTSASDLLLRLPCRATLARRVEFWSALRRLQGRQTGRGAWRQDVEIASELASRALARPAERAQPSRKRRETVERGATFLPIVPFPCRGREPGQRYGGPTNVPYFASSASRPSGLESSETRRPADREEGGGGTTVRGGLGVGKGDGRICRTPALG